jgi:hypothetical protein
MAESGFTQQIYFGSSIIDIFHLVFQTLRKHCSQHLVVFASYRLHPTIGPRDQSLRHCLAFGVGLHHAGLQEEDRKVVENLFCDQKIQILVATRYGSLFPTGAASSGLF